MTMENNEEYEGVTLHVDTTGWPDNLIGIVVKSQLVYVDRENNSNTVKIVGDPIWDASDTIPQVELEEE